ncbi:Phage Terminase [Lacrimispora sphenoides]|uniref:terminase large subunit domain-containing protein n=1 Tax=Lacrimispora sphenoides TaxID=29370 RepID=UPI0008CD9DC5|nr:terminase large subunit [Lacrimispora sphenoides]SEU08574.1 Phage Terminase [Lacrimispora sphenoides]
MLDAYQKIVYKKFSQSSWLSNKENYVRILDWITFYRRNIPVFVEHYLGITLHWYQIIWLYILNAYISVVIIAGRASAKSFVIAIFSCAKCILYPNTKVVVASGTKKQAALIVKEKIQKELMPKSENLRREIKKITTNANDIEVTFHNGSSIVVVVASEDALGYRSTILIFEEFKRIKKYIVDKVLKPFQMTRPAQYRTNEECEQYGVKYRENKEFSEEAVNIYISSAAPTSHWMGKLLKDTVKSKYGDGTSCILATDYSIALKHEIKTMSNLVDAKRTTDPITWREEYENEMLRENANAYFTYGLLTQNQVNKKAFYPRKLDDVRNKHKNPYAIPKQIGEVRVLACDMAFIERSNKNDNSCFTCIRALPESVTYESSNVDGKKIEVKNGYRRILSYIEANPGSDVDKQAIRIKQLFYDFEADYIVLDTRNGGILTYDRLAKVLYDEDRDCEYPAWRCMNDEVIANRVNVAGADENVFAINASQKLNNDIAIALRGVLDSKMIDLLVNLDSAQDILQNNIQEYSLATDPDIMLFYERPFLETQALLNEMISLEYTRNEQTGVISLYETGSNTKDRYVSLAYNSYFIGLLEQDLLSDNSDYEYATLIN